MVDRGVIEGCEWWIDGVLMGVLREGVLMGV